MNADLTLDVEQATEIKLAARRAGATNADLKRLTDGDMFARILPIIRGQSDAVIKKHIIDCSALPSSPGYLSVKNHRRRRCLEWDSSKLGFYASLRFLDADMVDFYDLYKELAKEPVLNANVLDYLLNHPYLIPEGLKWGRTFFWGTTYYDYKWGETCIRYLFFDFRSERWNSNHSDFRSSSLQDNDFAAILVE